MDYRETLLMTEFETHDVKRFVITRHDDFHFEPGEGVELTLDTPEWRTQKGHPFTPTSLSDDRVLEFTIKGYPEHHGMTHALHALRPGAAVLISRPFGAIRYKGPGVFIAGGAGITPFIAIVRDLAGKKKISNQHMIFSNKTPADVIYEKELRHLFGDRLTLTCTETKAYGYENRRIDKAFLTEQIRDFNQHFYVCGPPGFMKAVTGALDELGVESNALVFER